MDYLNLYQQAWAPTFLTFEAFGGFGVQNTDAEWNDARQAQFACTNLDYYRLTGKAEYMERGIAAVRAGFPTTYMPEHAFISPRTYQREPLGHADENYGHGGVDAPAGPTSWDWGTGSALTAVAYARRNFGDVWVDADRGRAFGINGVTATLRGDELDLVSSVQTVPTVLVRGAGKDLPNSLVVNGERRSVAPAAWRDGFLATPKADPRIRHRAPKILAADNAVIEFEVWPHDTAGASVTVAGEIEDSRRGDAPVTFGPGIVTVSRGTTVAERGEAAGVWWATLPVPPSSTGRQRLTYTISVEGGGAGTRYSTEVVAFGRASDLWTERFTGPALPERWRADVPVDGPVIRPGGGGLTIAVPGGRSFDQWVPQNDAPRVTTPVPAGDWSFAARLDTGQTPRRGLYHAGLAVEMGDNDYAFFGPSQGVSVMLERSGHNALGVSPFAGAMPREMDVRVRQAGGVLWFDWRPAGGPWSPPVALPGNARRVGFLVKTWEPIPAEVTIQEARMEALSTPAR